MASTRANRTQYFLSDTLALQTVSAVAQLVPDSNGRGFVVQQITCKLISASSPVGTAILTGSLATAVAASASLAAAVLVTPGNIIAVGVPTLPQTPLTGALSLTVGTALASGTAVVQFITWGYYL
jgi:hypothetical protein